VKFQKTDFGLRRFFVTPPKAASRKLKNDDLARKHLQDNRIFSYRGIRVASRRLMSGQCLTKPQSQDLSDVKAESRALAFGYTV